MTIPFDKPVICPILIGRTPYLNSLNSLMQGIKTTTGQTVLIAGEAGIGKSRLVEEAKKQAAGLGLLALQGNCFEPDRAYPYAPLLDLLRTFFASQSTAEIAHILDSTALELIKLLPELVQLLPEVIPTPPLEPEQEKRQLFRSFTQLFTKLTALQPLLVIIEDLHWSDDTSLEYLLHLARYASSQPILLLLTYRKEEIQSGLAQFLAGLDRERRATEWPLQPLTSVEADTMLQVIFELKRPTRPEFLRAIYSLTEGNPFFIEEILRALIASGDIFFAEEGWDRKAMEELHLPRSVQDAVLRRSQHLSPAAKDLLALAAVAGRHFEFNLLQNLTQRAEAELVELMKELIAAQLITEESAERFAFRHALTRQAIYLSLLARERQILHQKFGDILERLYAETEDSHLVELAYHFREAKNWGKALEYASRSGEKALELYALGAAVEHFSRALDAAKNLGIAPSHKLYHARFNKPWCRNRT